MGILKAIAMIAGFLRDLLSFAKELSLKQKLDQADAQHAENSDAINRAFDPSRVSVPASAGSSEAPHVAPTVPAGASHSPGVGPASTDGDK